MEQEDGHEEHEQVIAGQWLAAHDEPIGPGVPGGDPEPGRGVFRPALATFAFDLDAGQDDGEDCPEQGSEDD